MKVYTRHVFVDFQIIFFESLIFQIEAIESNVSIKKVNHSKGTVESGRCWVKAADVRSKVADVKTADVESNRRKHRLL